MQALVFTSDVVGVRKRPKQPPSVLKRPGVHEMPVLYVVRYEHKLGDQTGFHVISIFTQQARCFGVAFTL